MTVEIARRTVNMFERRVHAKKLKIVILKDCFIR